MSVEFVINKYKENGWEVMIPPQGTIVDIIARSDKKFHHVQVITNPEDPRAVAIAKNTFIQNAFSNGAIPVHALVKMSNKRGPDGARVATASVTFKDVNLSSRVIVGGKRTA